MFVRDILPAVIIYILIPLIGVLIYALLVKKIKKEKIVNPPIVDLFILFFSYGGLLLVILTSFFWQWSGMASLGGIYLVVCAPFIMGYIVYKNKKLIKISKYHKLSHEASVIYIVLIFLILILLFGINMALAMYYSNKF